jgi:hypothetical protein
MMLMFDEQGLVTRVEGRVNFHCTDFNTGAEFVVGVDCPIENRLHERQLELCERHVEWAERFELIPNERVARYRDTRFDTLIGYQYYGFALEAAVIASNLMTWFFVFDDNLDMDHELDAASRKYMLELCHRHVEILDGERPKRSDTNIVRAFADFLAAARDLAGAAHANWYLRMVHHLREYVHGTLWEGALGAMVASRANTAMYLQVRHMAVGVAPCHDLMAIAAGVDHRVIEANPFVRRLERLAINHSIWINDLAGLNRDQQKSLANVVFTLQQDHAMTRVDAARMVGRLCDGELRAFFQLEGQLAVLLGADWERSGPELLAYCDVLRRWMRGLLDWSARSQRYQCLNVDMSLQSPATIRDAAHKALG